MTQRLHLHGLEVARPLAELIALEVAPGTGIDPDHFWAGLSQALETLIPQNKALLAKRDELQDAIDAYYLQKRNNREDVNQPQDLEAFLLKIGYIVPEVKSIATTAHVDPEIATIAGPQLVVPVMNSRYALNAANARWGSLYDALYGSDIIPEVDGAEKNGPYNPLRGELVVQYAAEQLDSILSLEQGSHKNVIDYKILETARGLDLEIHLESGQITKLKNPELFIGHREQRIVLFKHHELHIELHFDHQSPIGRHHAAGLQDVILEAAVTTIQDCEDSVAAVDAEDKVRVYRSWLGLMQGILSETFEKNGKKVERQLSPDRYYVDRRGETLKLPGRSLMLVRNVGHLMTTDAVLFKGAAIPEGILDAFMTSFAALHDVKNLGRYKNSKTDSIYIVKPKMHGPEEVAFSVAIFNHVEKVLQLPENTLKIGIMDEERRTTLNLSACIAAAQKRIIFINTGFLDRTGDEIHTLMQAGPVVRKEAMKQQAWIGAYEKWNVAQGLKAELQGRAQIGKGMWAKPDLMAEMMATKASQLKAGANCAWVPSPTAAVLHALHYHQVDVKSCQNSLKSQSPPQRVELLQLPLAENTNWSAAEIRQEIENNIQGILGYVTRWIQFGIACSKVPDIHDIGLMEDRATLRISAQHVSNWLHHGICTQDEVMTAFKRMAKVVDRQNGHDPLYVPMSADFENSLPFLAACDLVFKGIKQPNGYTEPLLHDYRRRFKNT